MPFASPLSNDLFERLLLASREGDEPGVEKLLASHQALMDAHEEMALEPDGFEARALAARIAFRIGRAAEQAAEQGHRACLALLIAACPRANLGSALAAAAIHAQDACAELLVQASSLWTLQTTLGSLIATEDASAVARLAATPSWPKDGSLLKAAAIDARKLGRPAAAAAIESALLLASTPAAAAMSFGRNLLKA